MLLDLDRIQVKSQKLKCVVSTVLGSLASITFYVFIMTRIDLSNRQSLLEEALPLTLILIVFNAMNLITSKMQMSNTKKVLSFIHEQDQAFCTEILELNTEIENLKQ